MRTERSEHDDNLGGFDHLHTTRLRSFSLCLDLIANTISTCELAVHSGHLEFMEACEDRARRLCAKVVLLWSVNVPSDYLQELELESQRLKEMICELQRHREAAKRGTVVRFPGKLDSEPSEANQTVSDLVTQR